MKKHSFYLALQLAKYRTMTVSQLRATCEDFCGRSVFYDNLGVLKRLGLAQRVSHDMISAFGYIACPELDEALGHEFQGFNRPLRLQDLRHSFRVTDVMMELVRYSFVNGITHESELSPDAEKLFCPRRRPDAVIQIKKGRWTSEIAVEVELAKRSHDRIREVFSIYRDTILEGRHSCAGVIFVLYPNCEANIYHEERAKLPKSLQSKIIIREPKELENLNAEFFGVRSDTYGSEAGLKAGKVRTLSGQGVQYLPIISTNTDFQWAHIPT